MRAPTTSRRLLGAFSAWLAFGAGADAATLLLDFRAPVAGSIQDETGRGTGLTSRLPGTGGDLPADDPNLVLDTSAGVLNIASTRSDLNTQVDLGIGEYLGTKLSDLGFTGGQDFSVSATFNNVAYSENYDQYGLFVGTASDTNFRVGAIFIDQRYLFYVQNQGGDDHQLMTYDGLAPQSGDQYTLTLSRTADIYTLTVDNLTDPSRSGTLSNTGPYADTASQPTYLNGQADLYVGLFAANSGNDESKTLIVDSYSVNVATVPEPSTLVMACAGGLTLLGVARRQGRRG